ncbi:hypothetical protein CVT26_012131 [Gymnopilus dilepis]|uniref:Pyridoxamine kinase/Phosphomethylpyrimidine kinase domain-containing protein n=1 Tax=Gymnopilus dilepis TaxID=231916 RepID=A0A409YGP3_9AGAR|nr:hypothetical protein CVT26_012131 [Gymnopilus dilepis]
MTIIHPGVKHTPGTTGVSKASRNDVPANDSSNNSITDMSAVVNDDTVRTFLRLSKELVSGSSTLSKQQVRACRLKAKMVYKCLSLSNASARETVSRDDVPGTTYDSDETPESEPAVEGFPLSSGDHPRASSDDAPRAKPLKRDSNTFIEAWNGHMKVIVPRQDAVPTEQSGVYLVTGVPKETLPSYRRRAAVDRRNRVDREQSVIADKSPSTALDEKTSSKRKRNDEDEDTSSKRMRSKASKWSDSSGGAGIQADLKTFAAHGCYGASVITALTAQNTTGVQGVHPCPASFVEQQMTCVLDDLDVRAIKTGMLYDAEITKAVVDSLQTRSISAKLPPIICDPVCVSTSGHTLLQEDALDVLISSLFPLSTLITPNKSEAELLLTRLGRPAVKIHDVESMLFAAASLLATTESQAVLLKGGHVTALMKDVLAVQKTWMYQGLNVVKQNLLDENMEILSNFSEGLAADQELVVDILHEKEGNRRTMFVRPRIDSSSTHGTGCTLSSAIASELAKGSSLTKAVENAVMYTYRGIQAATPIGKGHGPLNHLHNIRPSLVPGQALTFTQMGGTQDYLYLKYYARAYGLLAVKSSTFPAIHSATQTILNILHEIGNHKSYCLSFGISEDELEKNLEASATTAYGAFILDTGLQGDAGNLVMALMACLLGYGEVGLWLKKESRRDESWVVLEGNPYLKWIEEYSGEMYQNAVRIGLETIEVMAESDPPNETRLKEWMRVWEKCTRLEKGFWDMAMELRD